MNDEQRLKLLGERVKFFREAKGWNQTMLADIAGVSLRLIQRLESGTQQPRILTFMAVAKALGKTPNDLMNVK